jgi:hypothetical protein
LVPVESKREQKQQKQQPKIRKAVETKQDLSALPAISETTTHDKTNLPDRQAFMLYPV